MNSIFFSSVLWVMQKASQIFKKSSNWKCSIWILSTPRESICKTTHPAQTTIHVISHQHVSKNHIHTAINEFVGKNEFFCILLKLASELAFQFLVWHSWHVDSRRDCEWTNSQSWKNQTKNIPTQADQNHDSFWFLFPSIFSHLFFFVSFNKSNVNIIGCLKNTQWWKYNKEIYTTTCLCTRCKLHQVYVAFSIFLPGFLMKDLPAKRELSFLFWCCKVSVSSFSIIFARFVRTYTLDTTPTRHTIGSSLIQLSISSFNWGWRLLIWTTSFQFTSGTVDVVTLPVKISSIIRPIPEITSSNNKSIYQENRYHFEQKEYDCSESQEQCTPDCYVVYDWKYWDPDRGNPGKDPPLEYSNIHQHKYYWDEGVHE